jgi:hypothetical protein
LVRTGRERRAIIRLCAGPPHNSTLIRSIFEFIGELGGSIIIVLASLGVSAVPNYRES